MGIRNRRLILKLTAAVIVALGAATATAWTTGDLPVKIERKTCRADDGVTIVYSAAGAGEPALVFVHGGMANRDFWDGQLSALAGRHRVIALDLPGHGESGQVRKKWGMTEFGADVRAVTDAEKLKKIVLFGNSLGGPVAVEAALLLPGRAIGVVGVDTFQALEEGGAQDAEALRQRAEAFRKDYRGSLKQMLRMLFHPDADPELLADAERRMSGTTPEAAYGMLMSVVGYSTAAAARKLTVPLRAINGDLYPTDVAGVRAVKPDFQVAVMKHIGHYPMLERPDEFNRLVAEVVASLDGKPK